MRLLAYRLLLPAIWLNTVFGNQPSYPGIVWLGQVFFWISLLLASFVVTRAFGARSWPYVLLTAIVVSRFAVAVKMPGAQIAYSGSTFILFGAAGVLLAIHAGEILARQSRMFLLLSVPVLILQVAGTAEWLHAFNTLYAVPGLNEGEIARPEIRMLPLLFMSLDDLQSTRMSDFEEFFNWQVRPPGLTHSNAMLGIFILAGLVIHFGRMNGKWMTHEDWLFVCVVVLCGSKLALLGFILLAFWLYLRTGAELRRRLQRIAMALVFVLLAYALLFPAAIQQNLAAGAFEASFFLRGVDAILRIMPDVALRIPAVLDVINTYPVSFSDETSAAGGRLSGIATLVFGLPFVGIAALFGLPWIIKGTRYCRSLCPEGTRTAGLMVVVLIVTPLATPIFASQVYSLCAGIAFMPIACGFSAKLRRRLACESRENTRLAKPLDRD